MFIFSLDFWAYFLAFSFLVSLITSWIKRHQRKEMILTVSPFNFLQQPTSKPEEDFRTAGILRHDDTGKNLCGPIKWENLPEAFRAKFLIQGPVETSMYLDHRNSDWFGRSVTKIFGDLQAPRIHKEFSTPPECIWSSDLIDKYIAAIKAKKDISPAYPGAAKDVEVGIKHALEVMEGSPKTMVMGSIWPWVEALLLAEERIKHVTTTDYCLPKCNPDLKDRITCHDARYALGGNLARNLSSPEQASFDLIVSFSSLEHDGLGRYGDPINPIGHLAALHEMRGILKAGGYLLLGVPIAPFDHTVFNAHRMFGPRFIDTLKEMFVLEAFIWNGEKRNSLSPVCLTSSWIPFIPYAYQPVMVLRKSR
jgi:hypothetical protein